MASEIKEDSPQPEIKKDENVIEKPHDIDNTNNDKKTHLSDPTQEKENQQEEKADALEENAGDEKKTEEKLKDKTEKSDKKEKPQGEKDQSKEKNEPPRVKNESKGKKDESKGKEERMGKKDHPKEKEEPSEKKQPEDDSEEDSAGEEEEVGLLDRPVEVSGCRARKKVERLEIGFSTPKEKQELPEGKGKKLGECPRIEAHIQKIKTQELKPLHKILFNRMGSATEIKKNIRKFSGFPFDENSTEYNRKKASLEKLTASVLKQACSILDIERGGTKDDIVCRIMSFLLNPEDSGKKVSSKKKPSKERTSKEVKKSTGKKGKPEKKDKLEGIECDSDENMDDDDDEEDSGGDESMGGSDEENEHDAVTEEAKPKSKGSKAKPKTDKGKKSVKSKAMKRKLDLDDVSENEKQRKKTNKMPSDDEISKLVKDILQAADLQEITMKKVIKQVSDAYPDFDLSHKKAFIKSTIKSVIS